MKKTNLRLTFAVALTAFVFGISCEKNEPINPQSAPSAAVQEDGPESSDRLRLSPLLTCEFNDLSAPNYITVLTGLFGATGGGNSVFNNYSRCYFPGVRYDRNCCGLATVELGLGNGVPGGFEEWGPPPGFTYDPLSDGTISASEQQAFFNRCIAEANAVRPACQGGSLILNGLTFSASPTLSGGGIVMHVYAHYAPVCYIIFGP